MGGGADASGPIAAAGAETEAAEQEARAPAAEAVAEAEAADDSAPENCMPGLHQESDGEDDDERIVYEPTNPSEPRCPSGDSSSDSEEEEATESLSKRARLSLSKLPLRSAAAPA